MKLEHLTAALILTLSLTVYGQCSAQCDHVLLGSPGSGYGTGAALDGETAVVVATLTDTAFILEFDGSEWIETQAVTEPVAIPSSSFADCVELTSGHLAIAAPTASGGGRVYLYQSNGTEWGLTQILTSPASAPHRFGESISIDGNRMLVGAPVSTDPQEIGRVYCYEYDGGQWNLDGALPIPSTPGGGAGVAVALDGDVAAVGVPFVGNNHGEIHLFARDGTGWTLEVTVDGTGSVEEEDYFGELLSLSGETLLVPVPRANGCDGAAFVYRRTVGVWSLEQQIDPSVFSGCANPVPDFATSGKIVGDQLVLASSDANGIELYRRSASNWVPQFAVSCPGLELSIADWDGERTISSGRSSGGPIEAAVISDLACHAVDFVRADCNGDGGISIADPIFLLNTQFGGGPASSCHEACDTNDDGVVDIADVVNGLSFLFTQSGPPLAPPYPDCGDDPTMDTIGCGEYACP